MKANLVKSTLLTLLALFCLSSAAQSAITILPLEESAFLISQLVTNEEVKDKIYELDGNIFESIRQDGRIFYISIGDCTIITEAVYKYEEPEDDQFPGFEVFDHFRHIGVSCK